MRVIIVRRDLAISRISVVTITLEIKREIAIFARNRNIQLTFFAIRIEKYPVTYQIRPFLYLRRFIPAKCCNKRTLRYFLKWNGKDLFLYILYLTVTYLFFFIHFPKMKTMFIYQVDKLKISNMHVCEIPSLKFHILYVFSFLFNACILYKTEINTKMWKLKRLLNFYLTSAKYGE